MTTANDALAAISTRDEVDRLKQVLEMNKQHLARFYSSLVTMGIPARYEEQFKSHCPYRFYHDSVVHTFESEQAMLYFIWEYLVAKEKAAAEKKRSYHTKNSPR